MSEKSMSLSPMAASAAMSLFCSLLSFLIVSPFARLRKAGRDNADHFFAIAFKPCVDDEKYHSWSNGSQDVPALFVLQERVALRQNIRIIENESRSLEADIMLQQVPLVLSFVPFKTHSRFRPCSSFKIPWNRRPCQYMCTYNCEGLRSRLSRRNAPRSTCAAPPAEYSADFAALPPPP